MGGIVSYGTYIPYFRLDRADVAAMLGSSAAKGTRSVACFDEDSTSMGVEAAREAIAVAPPGMRPESLYFATTSPAYLDKTNATAIHAALNLDMASSAIDMAGAVRSGVGALRAALDSRAPVLAVLSDIRTGLPGSADEQEGGDGAAAFLCGGDAPNAVVAEYIGGASATREFLDRWRLPGETSSSVWEERFGEEVYVPLGEQALGDALKAAGITMDAVDYLIVTGTHSRAVRRVAKASGARPEAVVDDLVHVVGNTGTAHPAILLASVLDRAEPDRQIALTVLADGAEVLLFRTTEALAGRRARWPVLEQIESGRSGLPYGAFLTWRDMLRREPLRRPQSPAPQGPSSLRSESWKFAFAASRCRVCGTRQLPPQRVCHSCHTIDEMDTESMAAVPGTVVTATVDRLAYHPNPPAVYVLVDYDGGGRLQCELTEADRDSISTGDRIEMTFRRVYTVDGIHNYFWKARPIRRRVA